jgi:hypothetical protein
MEGAQRSGEPLSNLRASVEAQRTTHPTALIFQDDAMNWVPPAPAPTPPCTPFPRRLHTTPPSFTRVRRRRGEKEGKARN